MMITDAERLRKRVMADAAKNDLTLTEVEQESLDRACDLANKIDELRAAVELEGTTVVGPGGITRVHPALSEERSCIALLHKIVASIELNPKKVGLSPSEQNRMNANGRWAGRGRPTPADLRRPNTATPERKTPLPDAI